MPLKTKEKKSTMQDTLKDWTISIIIAIVLSMFVRYFIVEPYLVDGTSMNPTLQPNERLLVSKFAYTFSEPKKNDIIVFKYPSNQTRDFIKRVIAVPGETFEIRDGVVYVNGQKLQEDYILENTRGSYPKVIIPSGHVFVMGDNRNNSEDSRYPKVGFVPYSLIKGKGVLIFWPFELFRKLP